MSEDPRTPVLGVHAERQRHLDLAHTRASQTQADEVTDCDGVVVRPDDDDSTEPGTSGSRAFGLQFARLVHAVQAADNRIARSAAITLPSRRGAACAGRS
jgi:hypothetical protein